MTAQEKKGVQEHIHQLYTKYYGKRHQSKSLRPKMRIGDMRQVLRRKYKAKWVWDLRGQEVWEYLEAFERKNEQEIKRLQEIGKARFYAYQSNQKEVIKDVDKKAL